MTLTRLYCWPSCEHSEANKNRAYQTTLWLYLHVSHRVSFSIGFELCKSVYLVGSHHDLPVQDDGVLHLDHLQVLRELEPL